MITSIYKGHKITHLANGEFEYYCIPEKRTLTFTNLPACQYSISNNLVHCYI